MLIDGKRKKRTRDAITNLWAIMWDKYIGSMDKGGITTYAKEARAAWALCSVASAAAPRIGWKLMPEYSLVSVGGLPKENTLTPIVTTEPEFVLFVLVDSDITVKCSISTISGDSGLTNFSNLFSFDLPFSVLSFVLVCRCVLI